ncbi:MAG: TrkH family potassium uptake protein [Holdemania massiliensis]
MQYCGGLGFVMVMTLFIQNKQSMNLFQAEGHSDQLTPNLGRTVRVIVLMYTTFLIFGVAAYRIAGMSLFDGLIHAMCALSTGGFSTRVESIGYYNSPLIEFITIILMLIGTTNFAALLLLMRRQVRQFLAVSEVRFMGLLLAGAVPLTALVLFSAAYARLSDSFRIALFEVVSALSTTGFSTVGYGHWPQAAVLVLIVMMLIGGGVGSTAGGMKLTRVYLMLRAINNHLRNKNAPEGAVSLSFYTRPQGRPDRSKAACGYFLLRFQLLADLFYRHLPANADRELFPIEAMFDLLPLWAPSACPSHYRAVDTASGAGCRDGRHAFGKTGDIHCPDRNPRAVAANQSCLIDTLLLPEQPRILPGRSGYPTLNLYFRLLFFHNISELKLMVKSSNFSIMKTGGTVQ